MARNIYTDKNGEYLKNNPTWHVEDSPWKAKQIIKMLNRNAIPIKTVAEVGCGAGEILNQLHSSLPEDVFFKGYDVSIDAINLAKQRQKARLEVSHENFLDANVYYDLLLMMDVFEHVEDYIGFIKTCKTKAKYTIFHIPLDMSVQMVFRNKLISVRKSIGHLHYFMKDTALATLEDSGFEIVDHFYTPGMLELTKKTTASKIGYLPRKLLYMINEDFAAKTIGGFALLVLAKAK